MVTVHRFKNPGWRSVFVAFVVVALLLATTSSMVFFANRRAQQQGEELMQNAIVSVELVESMGANIARLRLLLAEHIHESRAQAMARIEKQMDETRADYWSVAGKYAQFVNFPGEAEVWQTLQDHVAALEKPIAAVLALSRENRDIEAVELVRGIDNLFWSVDREVDNLDRINRNGAQEAVVRHQDLRRWSSVLFSSVFALQVILTLAIGVWTTRVVRRREDEVGRYAEMLEWRNRELDAFAGRVAHDLGGPLTTITLAATNLGRRVREEEKTVAILQRAVTRMHAIIEDLLALSRIDASTGAKTCDPAAVAAQVREEMAERLAAEAVSLTLDVQACVVHCADGLLRQVLVNLIDNAAKYRRPDVASTVHLVGKQTAGSYLLELTDNGVGMSEDEARHAFDPFFRAPRVSESKGTGLGLSIVKRVMDASGGSVAIDSQLGQGTTVRVSLLVADAAAAKPVAATT